MWTHREWAYKTNGIVSTTLIRPQMVLQVCTRIHRWNNQDPKEYILVITTIRRGNYSVILYPKEYISKKLKHQEIINTIIVYIKIQSNGRTQENTSEH